MKFFLIIAITIGTLSSIRAENYYSKFHVKFEVQTKSKQFICFNEIDGFIFNVDSIKNHNYLINSLTIRNSPDSLMVFNDRISYKYCIENVINCLETEKDSIFILFNKTVINIDDIINIKILESIQVPVFDNIYTKLLATDTTWRKDAPKEILYCVAYLCSHKIFIYKTDKQVASILSEIRAFQSEIDEQEKENIVDSSNGDFYDFKLFLLIDKLPLENIVLISACTD